MTTGSNEAVRIELAHTPSALRELLSRVIDYAGMFPPAALPLEPAIRNFAKYLHSADAWMLGRFICPAGKLRELLPFARERFGPDRPLTISALGHATLDGHDHLKAIREDLEHIRAFRSHAGRHARVEVFETKLPDDLVAAPRVVKELAHAAEMDLRAFCEIPPVMSVSHDRTIAFIKTIAAGHYIGVKLRCGGTEAAAFPTSGQIASVIVGARDAGVPLKLTAGLHHPIRHFNAGVKAKMHGFVNVFVAGLLARVGHRNEKELTEILDDEAPANFQFFDHGLAWRTTKAMTAQATAARRDGVLSFGSCSFDEPRDDMRALGWLK